MPFILQLSNFIMVVKRAKEELQDGAKHIKDEFERLDRLKLDISSSHLTLLLNGIRTSTEVIDGIRTSSFNLQIKIFGKDGVGGLTSDKLCVEVDGSKATVWVGSGIYAILNKTINERIQKTEGKGLVAEIDAETSKKHILEMLSKPDELMEMQSLRNYAPVFKALSNCDISVKSVNVSDNLSEIEDRLRSEHRIISELADSVKEHGFKDVLDALKRYADNKVETPVKTEPLADPFRIKFETLKFESELTKELYDMRTIEVCRAMDSPFGEKIRVTGSGEIGVIDTDDLVVQIDKSKAKVFLDDSAYFVIGREVLRDLQLPPQEASQRIIKNSETIPAEIRHLPSILKVLSELGVKISEFAPKNDEELKNIAEVLVEQNWIASRYRHQNKPQQEILQEIVDAVPDSRRINSAFRRYGIKEQLPVSAARVPEKEELIEQPSTPITVSGDLVERIHKKLEAMRTKFVDEKIGAIEIVGFGELKTINLHEDIVINCKKEKASIIIDEELLSSALKYASLGEDDAGNLIGRLDILEKKAEFREFVATVRALKMLGVAEFKITEYGHDADYYLRETRTTCEPAAAFMENTANGKRIGEIVEVMMGSITKDALVDSLSKTGFHKEAEAVLEYINLAKITREKINRMIDEWVKGKAVPGKEELLVFAKSVGMNQSGFEKILESTVREMKESNAVNMRNVANYQNRADEGGVLENEFESFVKEGNKKIEENEARIKKLEEALGILRGS